MFSYDTDSEPITPYFSISVANRYNYRKSKKVDAIIDTGADDSCIPMNLIRELELQYTKDTVFDFRDEEVEVIKSRVLIRINNEDFVCNVTCIPTDVALIGRDIFNKYKVVLNAPSQVWGINCSCQEGGCTLSGS